MNILIEYNSYSMAIIPNCICICHVQEELVICLVSGLRRIENAVLDKVKTILEVGILLDHRLNFRDNTSMIMNKFFGIHDYMKRWSEEFLLSVFILEYSSFI